MTKPAVTMKMLNSGVALVTLDLPDSKYNLLSERVLRDLIACLDQAASDKAVKGMVIHSGKPDNFVFGANIEEIQAVQNQTAKAAYDASNVGKEIFSKIEKMPFRVVVAINGICLGGGTEMSLACHYRIASNHPKTAIGLPEVKLGFIPGWGGTVRLTRLIGLPSAVLPPLPFLPRGIGWGGLLTGATADPAKAWRLGLVDETVEESALLERAEQIALTGKVKRYVKPLKVRVVENFLTNTAAGRSLVFKAALSGVMKETRGKYPAPVEALKVAVKAVGNKADRKGAMEAESRAFGRLAVSAVSKRLVNIFFAQTESKKARNNAAPALKVKKIGVIGAGVMGAGIAQAAAYAGYEVVLKDIKQEALDAGMATVKGLFDGLVAKKKLSVTEGASKLAAVRGTLSYADMADCDMVIEAVVEVMKVKKIVLADLEKAINKPFIFATNTSSLSITEMAQGARNPELVVGVHFLNPVHKMPLVEIIFGGTTSDGAAASAQEFALKLGKTTVFCLDRPGFIVNAILTPYLLEAVKLLEQGVAIEEIEKTMQSFGMPMGPLTLLDEVGLDVAGHVARTLNAAFGDRLAPPALLKKVDEAKMVGKKGGEGIYSYAEGKRTTINPKVAAWITAQPTKKQRGEIQDRLALAMVNEAARVLESGIVSDPRTLDLAMIFGTGFPPFLGGPLSYADSVGIKVIHQKLEMLSRVAGENYAPCQLIKDMAARGESFYRD